MCQCPWCAASFGLSYSNISISQGVYLVRVKDSEVVLSDKVFVDAAGQAIQQRLRGI